MERRSERIWAAARAAFESRREALEWKTTLDWKALGQRTRDIEYDAMVAALDVWVGPPWTYPDEHDRAERFEATHTAALARIAELEAEREKLDMAYVRLRKLIPGAMPAPPHWGADKEWTHTEAMLKCLLEERDGLARAWQETLSQVWANADRVRVLYAALKPFAEYAERIAKERPGWYNDAFRINPGFMGGADVTIPMAWFIAALKVYCGEVAAEMASEDGDG